MPVPENGDCVYFSYLCERTSHLHSSWIIVGYSDKICKYNIVLLILFYTQINIQFLLSAKQRTRALTVRTLKRFN